MRPLRICLLGGIFGKPPSYRAAVQSTPETTLAAGLRERGHVVATAGLAGSPGDLRGFDVVHAHHLAQGTVLAAAARERGAFAFTSHWFEESSPARRAAQRYVLARADASIVLSETEARWQRRIYPGVASKQQVIPNGVDAGTFAFAPPPAAPRDGEPWRLLYVGQLSRFKGVDYLLDALPALAGRMPVELSLAYHVDTEKASLEEQAARLGVEAVRFLGMRSPRELARLYAGSHLLVLPSTGEAMPLVISEALLVGRPVVGTDVGAVSEQVGDFGRVVAPRDAVALAQAIEEVCRGYSALAARAQEVSKAAQARYAIDAVIDAHGRLYLALAERGPLRRRGDELLDWPLRRLVLALGSLSSRRPDGGSRSEDEQAGADEE